MLLGQWLGKEPKELSSYSDVILEHCRYIHAHTVEPLNKRTLGTRHFILFSEV